MAILTGSICLSDIPKEEIKKIMCKDGKERMYLNVAVISRKEKSQFGHTHFITCSPKKEERKDGISYIIGDLKEYIQQQNSPTPEQIAQAPAATASEINDLPF